MLLSDFKTIYAFLPEQNLFMIIFNEIDNSVKYNGNFEKV